MKIDLRTVLVTALVVAVFLAVVRRAAGLLPPPLSRLGAWL